MKPMQNSGVQGLMRQIGSNIVWVFGSSQAFLFSGDNLSIENISDRGKNVHTSICRQPTS